MDAKSSGHDREYDLFGNPVEPLRDRRGRPSFAKTVENQRVVIDLASYGWNAERIGQFLGCDRKTVVKHFSRELESGKTLVEGEAILVQTALMRRGKLRAVEKVLTRTAAVPVGAAKGKAPPKGKKETLSDAAAEPPGAWATVLTDRRPN